MKLNCSCVHIPGSGVHPIHPHPPAPGVPRAGNAQEHGQVCPLQHCCHKTGSLHPQGGDAETLFRTTSEQPDPWAGRVRGKEAGSPHSRRGIVAVGEARNPDRNVDEAGRRVTSCLQIQNEGRPDCILKLSVAEQEEMSLCGAPCTRFGLDDEYFPRGRPVRASNGGSEMVRGWLSQYIFTGNWSLVRGRGWKE